MLVPIILKLTFAYLSSPTAHKAAGMVDAMAQASQNAHRELIEKCLHHGGASSSIVATTSHAELTALKTNVGKACYFTILVEFHRSKTPSSVDKVLGKNCASYAEDLTMDGMPFKVSANYFLYSP